MRPLLVAPCAAAAEAEIVSTRPGTSTSRDACPGLSLLVDEHTPNIGSDRNLIQLSINGRSYNAHVGSAHIPNWDHFRKGRTSRGRNPGASYDKRTKESMQGLKTHTEIIASTYV